MAKILVLLCRRLGGFFSENKFKFFCSLCLLLLLITALTQDFGNRSGEAAARGHHELFQLSHLKFNKTVQDIFPFVVEATLPDGEKKFPNEESRIVGFAVNSHTFQGTKRRERHSTKVIYLATEYFSEYNPRHYYFPHFGQRTFARYPCPVNQCFVTKDPKDSAGADAVLFHVRDLVIYKFPKFRNKNQVWILYSMEPPWLELFDMRRLNGIFNWTMSYRKGSDVMVKYGFVGRRLIPLGEKMILREESFRAKEDRAVWYVSNCCTDGRRENYVAELMKHFPIDVLGGCGKEGCRPAETQNCYRKIETKYKFYIAFENAICQNYVTEKLFNVLEYKIIPVVFGGAGYNELVPKDSVINALEFRSPKELASHLWLVSRNITMYRSYFKWKARYRAYLQPWMCDLCEKLHSENISAPARHDLVTWWHEEHSCRRWTENGMEELDPGIYALPSYHTRIFQ